MACRLMFQRQQLDAIPSQRRLTQLDRAWIKPALSLLVFCLLSACAATPPERCADLALKAAAMVAL